MSKPNKNKILRCEMCGKTKALKKFSGNQQKKAQPKCKKCLEQLSDTRHANTQINRSNPTQSNPSTVKHDELNESDNESQTRPEPEQVRVRNRTEPLVSQKQWVYAETDGYWRDCTVILDEPTIRVIKVTATGEICTIRTQKELMRLREDPDHLLLDQQHRISISPTTESKRDDTPQIQQINNPSNNNNETPPLNIIQQFALYNNMISQLRTGFPNIADDKIKEFASNEYNRRMNIKQTDYSKMIYNESRMQSFKTKFPENENEF